jgi:linoleoyl-CoA desaturase
MYMKFEKGKNSVFFDGLNKKVEAYFAKHNHSRFARPALFVKGGVLLAVYGACYSGIYLFSDNYSVLTCLYLLLGISGVMIVFNIVHDASHQAVSRNKTVNNSLRYLGDLVGINTYIWDIRHNIQHHSFTNVLGGDIVIENIPLIRMSPHQPHNALHRYQVYYAPLLYLCYSFYWIFIIDFRLFFQKEICNLKNIRHPFPEWVKLFFFKSFYIFYMILLPWWCTGLSFWAVTGFFFLMHAAGGLLLSFVAVLGHFVEGPVFPEAKNGLIAGSWSEHELEATIDFAPSSRIINWLTGGLNTHVAHHLYPRISHSHYFALTKIIEKHCRMYGYPYRKEPLLRALGSHFRYLKKLGVAG